jgi:hypothetical protein
MAKIIDLLFVPCMQMGNVVYRVRSVELVHRTQKKLKWSLLAIADDHTIAHCAALLVDILQPLPVDTKRSLAISAIRSTI